MLKCAKCGVENPLGRVFCGACGSKLDLSSLTSEFVSEQHRVNFFRLHLRAFVNALVLIPVALLALALWPRLAPIGTVGNAAGTSNIGRQLGVLSGIGPGRSISIEVAEKDLNGYFQYSRIKKTKITSLSLHCVKGAFSVQMVVPLIPPIAIGPVSLEPKISYSLLVVPVGKQFRVVRAHIGHLRAFGPLKRVAVNPFMRLIAGGKEAAVLDRLSEVRCEEGKFVLLAGG